MEGQRVFKKLTDTMPDYKQSGKYGVFSKQENITEKSREVFNRPAYYLKKRENNGTSK